MPAQRCQALIPESLVVRHPVKDFAKRRGVSPVEPVPPRPALGDKPRPAQHTQMLRERGLRHAPLEVRADLARRALPVREQVEDPTPRGVRDGVKNRGVESSSGHGSIV